MALDCNHRRNFTSIHCLVTCVCLQVSRIVVLLLSAVAVVHAGLSVESLDPQPNYDLTTDAWDMMQLTDGHLTSGRMWLGKDAVGWVWRTPVVIGLSSEMDLDAGDSRNNVLRFRVGSGAAQGVVPVRRIDIYGLDEAAGVYLHVGEYMSDEKTPASGSHWVEVRVTRLFRTLKVVLHAEKAFVFLDEIEVGTGNASQTSRLLNMREDATSDPKTDSMQRLRRSLLAAWAVRHAPRSSARVGVGDSRRCAMHFESCWTGFGADGTNLESRVWEVNGYLGEAESVCLAVTGANAVLPEVVLTGEELGGLAGVRHYEVKEILAADGAVVHDVLNAIEQPYRFRLDSGSVRHFMFVMPIAEELPDEVHFKAATDAGNCNDSLTLSINKTDIGMPDGDVRGVVWGYPQEGGVWKYPGLVADDFASHGANVNVVHPLLFMPKSAEKRIAQSDFAKLAEHVKGFRPGTEFLLFMGLEKPGRAESLGLDRILQGKRTDPDEVDRFRAWLEKLSAVMNKAGHGSTWWLYPFDEPEDAELGKISLLGRKLSEQGIKARIYANPSTSESRNTRATVTALDRASPYVDLWQPRLSFAENQGRSFFEQLDKQWLVYHNPPVPAKSADPFVNYRQPAWRAWMAGAGGVGFWSYSDTGSSSAWDDFDGYSPDWAVVYESDAGPIPSVRWEAFREGVEDLRLLRSLEAAVPGGISQQDLRQMAGRVSRDASGVYALESVRKGIMKAIVH